MDFSTLTRNEPGLTSGELNMDYTGFSDGVPPATESEGSCGGSWCTWPRLHTARSTDCDYWWQPHRYQYTSSQAAWWEYQHIAADLIPWWRPCQIPRERPKQQMITIIVKDSKNNRPRPHERYLENQRILSDLFTTKYFKKYLSKIKW